MKHEYVLVCRLEDGRIVQCNVDLEYREGLARAVGLSAEELRKHRLFDAYIAIEHLINPSGPPLPPHIAELMKECAP